MIDKKSLNAEQIRKTYHLFDCFVGPLGGNYSLWITEYEIIGIHDDDDDDVVSVFDIEKGMFTYIDELQKNGLVPRD
jgi:hypothetical protein